MRETMSYLFFDLGTKFLGAVERSTFAIRIFIFGITLIIGASSQAQTFNVPLDQFRSQ